MRSSHVDWHSTNIVVESVLAADRHHYRKCMLKTVNTAPKCINVMSERPCPFHYMSVDRLGSHSLLKYVVTRCMDMREVDHSQYPPTRLAHPECKRFTDLYK